MSLYEIISSMNVSISEIAVIVIVILSVIQITPIKINPWSKLAEFIGKSINKNVIEEVDSIKTDVKTINDKINILDCKMNENSAKEARVRILKFADEVSHAQPHSRNSFQQIMSDITLYKKYCKEHPEFKNDMTKIDTERIEEDYKMRDSNNSFL